MSGPIRNYWFADDPFKSLFFGSLSVSIPESERFIAATARAARPLITDPLLVRSVDILIHEEEAHTRVHEAYNELLRKQGYHFARFEAFERALSRFFAERSLKTRLALCMCGEFFTAVMGCHLVQQKVVEVPGIDERMRALWTWHSLEELDHRGTAAELYHALDGGYLRRATVMLLMTTLYFITHLLCFRALLHQDKVKRSVAERSSDHAFLYGRDGFYRAVLTPWLHFFVPGFTPQQDIHLAPGIAEELQHIHIEDHFVAAVAGT